MTVDEFLSKVKPVFPSLRKRFDSAVCILQEACSVPFMLASECLFTLESVVISLQIFFSKLEGNSLSTNRELIQGVLHVLHSRLVTSSQKLLKRDWNNETIGRTKMNLPALSCLRLRRTKQWQKMIIMASQLYVLQHLFCGTRYCMK